MDTEVVVGHHVLGVRVPAAVLRGGVTEARRGRALAARHGRHAVRRVRCRGGHGRHDAAVRQQPVCLT